MFVDKDHSQNEAVLLHACLVFFDKSKIPYKLASVESSFLLRQRFTPRQLSKDNRPIVLLLFLTFLHAKDIWRNIHVFQRGKLVYFVPLLW